MTFMSTTQLHVTESINLKSAQSPFIRRKYVNLVTWLWLVY